jgi:hypothetical protein
VSAACEVREVITDLVVLDNEELSFKARGLLLHLTVTYAPGTQVACLDKRPTTSPSCGCTLSLIGQRPGRRNAKGPGGKPGPLEAAEDVRPSCGYCLNDETGGIVVRATPYRRVQDSSRITGETHV